jgi:hypothetical protein
LSPETRNLAISLNKHKLEDVSLRPHYLKDIEIDLVLEHKKECQCEISEVEYQKYTIHCIGEFKIFISCKYAASDLPQLTKHKIGSILTIGEEPKCFPSIKGGYCKVAFDGISILRPLQQMTRFLNAKLKSENVLVHCENCLIKSFLMCYKKQDHFTN